MLTPIAQGEMVDFFDAVFALLYLRQGFLKYLMHILIVFVVKSHQAVPFILQAHLVEVYQPF
ncbi:MAG: hypothetical protein B6D77_03455 [gamma proteobacterium symbiont of Ctena orbiculata]|nr:MAG: hypothetical protein B6D77_03455 [gamma proteobacterium symbiont of Ctena orbiculata]